jgi:predicted nucleic-acid-binding Zn-ribbon protein
MTKCPNCGGQELYRSTGTTPARGLFGPDLLPESAAGRFRVVVCKDCGMTTLFASALDTQALSRPGWEKVLNAPGPLGLNVGSE